MDIKQQTEKKYSKFVKVSIKRSMKALYQHRQSLLAMSKKKAPGPDDITSDILLLRDEPVLKYLTSCSNGILKSRKIPACWEEAKIIIYKKGDPGDIKNYRPISLLSLSYKLFTRLLQKRMERILDENQPRDQAGFRKGYIQPPTIFTP
ncbi:RNA-directed DNA polymerase (reverse transcriptase) domain containing protein [Plakobranchus ocellatus]|uniref:RNA-directed DNA polymerase (Reverse transcriptase) domain containing protein n=1 Tax=Plakobranchus ocellatus TaxID=259542 RepID=A0AAV4E1T3_9GAST|nr:RNA-directed DNA polymerase (reverse transcriptase) domain containing protein [Plakobranchus ocellatus]